MLRRLAVPMLVAALALGACAKVGALDQPAPLFGAKAKADYAAKKQAQAAARAAHKEQKDPDALPPDHEIDPYTQLGPQRDHPIIGQPSDPSGPSPGGVIPDPMTQPQGPQ